MKKQLAYIWIFIIFLLGWSCLHEEEWTSGKPLKGEEVSFRFTMPGSSGTLSGNTRAMVDQGGNGEEGIRSLTILAFRDDVSSGEVLDYKLDISPSDITSSGGQLQFTAKVKIGSDRQRFVLIANAQAETAAISAKGQLKSTVMDALVRRHTGEWNATSSANYDPIPMWGESGLAMVSAGGTVGIVKLHRMVARIDVKVTSTNAFKLKSVHLYNRKNRGKIVPNQSSSYWDDTESKALKASMPADNDPTGDPLTIKGPLDYTTMTTFDEAIEASIYTFEATPPESGLPEDATCLVVGGTYTADGSTCYYRIDFLDKTATPHIYKDILRNYHYEVGITGVSAKGYGTADDAFTGNNLLTAYINEWNLSAQKVIADGQYFLEVSEDKLGFDRAGGTLNITVETDYNIVSQGYPKGLYVEVDYSSSSASDWITVGDNGATGDGDTYRELKITVPTIPVGIYGKRSAKINITAGNFTKVVTVNQDYPIAPFFARSNIVYKDGKLTFAEDDNSEIKANVQGVMFKWGSLLALSGEGPTNKNFSSSDVVYDPRGLSVYNNWFTDVPYCEIVRGSYPHDYDAFVDRYGSTGYNVSQGKGDICRYISDQGWVQGRWRIPTYQEYVILHDETIQTLKPPENEYTYSGVQVGTLNNIITTGDNQDYGLYELPGGRLFGAGATEADANMTAYITDPGHNRVFFPPSGRRGTSSSSRLDGVGTDGQMWSCGIMYNLSAYLYFREHYSMYQGMSSSIGGIVVRCIRE